MFRRAVTAAVAVLTATAVVVPTAAVSAHAPERGWWDDRSHRCTPDITGMQIVESTRSFDETWDALIATLDANPNIGIVATLDHAANAASIGEELLPTREVFFGNPNLGTPIMQTSQDAGIDLPQKMLVWQDEIDRVFLGYNSPDYVAARHGAEAAPTLDTIAGALANLAAAATGIDPGDDGKRRRSRSCRWFGQQSHWRAGSLWWIAHRPGLVWVDSVHDVDTTFQRLIDTIEAAPPNILFTLEHDQNAARVGLDLAPTKLIVFGNPALGTPLMQRHQSVGIDLPQKFLVVERADGTVQIGYNNPRFIVRRHGVRGERDTVQTIRNALAGLAGSAAGVD